MIPIKSSVRFVLKLKPFTKCPISFFHIKFYHRIPFKKLYEKTTGEKLSEDGMMRLTKKHPHIDTLSEDRLHCTLQILEKYNITSYEALKDPHVFSMNPITMDNYGEILKECGFLKIIPNHIIRYHTLVKSRTLQQLKKSGLIEGSMKLEEKLLQCFHKWPDSHSLDKKIDETSTSIVTIRMYILEKYLNWKLNIEKTDFDRFCRNYLPFRHKPMCDIQEAIDIALNVIGFSIDDIKRCGFIISTDPVNTKLILENVTSIAGVDIKEVIKIEPAIIKNNYNSIVEIRSLLEEYRISHEAQRRCFKTFCMSPKTVRERLEELIKLKEYAVFSTNPRFLSMIVHKRKLISRLDKMQAANKQCYSLNHLISSSKVFNNYVNNFGNKACGRDIATLISMSLNKETNGNVASQSERLKEVLASLKRHKFWLHTALNDIHQNICLLQKHFANDVILLHCQLLLYPMSEIEYYMDTFLRMRSGQTSDVMLDNNYSYVAYACLTDGQLLSLILYAIEKKYHFSGEGIWAKPENKMEAFHI